MPRPPLRTDVLKLFKLEEQIDLGNAPEDEIEKHAAWQVVHWKVLQAMFVKYAGISKNQTPVPVRTFDDI